jgi:hypothetical protein
VAALVANSADSRAARQPAAAAATVGFILTATCDQTYRVDWGDGTPAVTGTVRALSPYALPHRTIRCEGPSGWAEMGSGMLRCIS